MSTREVNITLNELVGSLTTNLGPGALDKLLGAKLPAALSFRLSMLMDAVAPPTKHYNEARESLLKEWGKKTEDGQHYTFENGSRAKFDDALAELLREPITLTVPVLKVSDLGEREILTPAEFFAVRWLFAEEEDKPAG